MFKIGDFAIWNGAPIKGITHGKAYEVLQYTIVDDACLITFRDDDGMMRQRYARRFKKQAQMWLCVKKGAHAEVGLVYEAIREMNAYLLIHANGQDVMVGKSRFVKQGNPQPFKPEPVKEPELPTYIKQLEDKVGKGYKMGTVACYAVFNPAPSWHTQDVCHARLRGTNRTVGAATWINSHNVKGEHQDTYRAYVKWIVQDSSFKRAFLQNMTLDQMMSSGVEFDVTQDASVVYTGAIALRMFHEHKYFREVFHALYKHGFDMTVCFLVASGYKGADHWKGLDDWHAIMGSSTSLLQFKKVMGGLFKGSRKFNQVGGYEDYFCAAHFTEGGGESINALVKRMLDKRFIQKVDGGWGGKIESTPMEFAPAIAVLLTKEYANG